MSAHKAVTCPSASWMTFFLIFWHNSFQIGLPVPWVFDVVQGFQWRTSMSLRSFFGILVGLWRCFSCLWEFPRYLSVTQYTVRSPDIFQTILEEGSNKKISRAHQDEYLDYFTRPTRVLNDVLLTYRGPFRFLSDSSGVGIMGLQVSNGFTVTYSTKDPRCL